ncbi:uncharacterized protein F5Z01DRAFT_672399 [Emericellopsis atlantica]|uniref:Uncharacterized protein n=1 Tax=Emericellopsis atlantica TaxID=2614577 RepID=A0A9P7ZRD8_9HYPO|nr:uncharacterized protein F5Z01DRAFT_672399 [Emericellopsis atlantica]KAG9256412.1 hypothetical protein F5Z01DRAFT_672399 [Emericellopsis atlantica]
MDTERCTDQPWGSLASNVVDAPSCIADCRQKFLATLLPERELIDETLEPVCEHLSKESLSLDEAFWTLYCCDAQLCGVDNLAGRGKDPNVNWVISSCQNIGFDHILDPGPPEIDHSCGSANPVSQSMGCLTTGTPVSTMRLQAVLPTSLSLSTASSSTVQTTQTSAQPPIRDPSLAANMDNESSSVDSDSPSPSGLSTGVKATIGLSATVAALLIAVAIFFLLRRRRMVPPHRRRRFFQRDNSSFSTLGSPTPLVSPPPFSPMGAEDVPLTPPPPLRERRMLDTRSSTSSSRRPSGFSRPPMLTPTLGKLIPRSETFMRGLCPPSATHGMVNSVRSSSESQGALSSPARSFCSPSKPAGLPSSPQRHGNIGVAVGIVRHNPAEGVVLDKNAQDLCELTDEYARESRDTSWGSWRGGGGPGRVASEQHVGGSVMRERDLERLGGRY